MPVKRYLDAKDVPAFLRCRGTRRYIMVVTEAVHLPADYGMWSDGSRDEYTAVDLEAQLLRSVGTADFSEIFSGTAKTKVITLRPGFAVAMDGVFLGKSTGRTIFIHPDNATKFLPPPPADELTHVEKMVLLTIRTYIPSYRREHLARKGIRPVDYEATREALKVRGYLINNGALTTKGKNAALLLKE